MPNDVDDVVAVVKDICGVDVIPDGLNFDAASVIGVVIDDDDEYSGVRITFKGFLANAEVPMQLDIGFGDVVIPKPKEIEYPVILDFPSPKLRVYPFECTIAEKFEAMIHLGEINSRMKDFYDIWFLSRNSDFDGETLQRAIESTFKTRSTIIPDDLKGLLGRLDTADKTSQWTAFIKRSDITDCPREFSAVLTSISLFLSPVIRASVEGVRNRSIWKPTTGWKQATPPVS